MTETYTITTYTPWYQAALETLYGARMQARILLFTDAHTAFPGLNNKVRVDEWKARNAKR